MNFYGHDWKGTFINKIINDLSLKSYLELGISRSAETWKLVNCSFKTGVDSDPLSCIHRNIINSTTDDFFLKNKFIFDLIYIDAMHEKEQVKKDFINSFNCLSDDGIIIFHDINPLHEKDTSFNASGDVYSFWINMCNYYNVFSYIGFEGDTVGIFLKKENTELGNYNYANYSYDYFKTNREKYINNLSYEEMITKIKNYLK